MTTAMKQDITNSKKSLRSKKLLHPDIGHYLKKDPDRTPRHNQDSRTIDRKETSSPPYHPCSKYKEIHLAVNGPDQPDDVTFSTANSLHQADNGTHSGANSPDQLDDGTHSATKGPDHADDKTPSATNWIQFNPKTYTNIRISHQIKATESSYEIHT